MASLFVLVSDMHVGSKMALCPPTVTLDEGGTYRANKAQLWMWPYWLEFWDTVKKLRKKKVKGKKPDLSVGIVGEFRDGTYYTSQSITTNEADIFRMVQEVIEPIKATKPDQTFVWRGSRAHSGNASWFDEVIADGLQEELNVQQNPNTGAFASWEMNVEIEDILFDITHHVSMGQLPHTEKPSVARAAEVLKNRYGRNERLPDIAIRGHQHRMHDTGSLTDIRMITLPSWKFPDAHIIRFAQSGVPHFGGVIFEIDGDEIKNCIKFRKSPPRGKPWRKKK